VGARPTTGNRLRALWAHCATPGLDAVYIGPAELAISMGPCLTAACESPRHSEAVDAIRKTCEKHDIVAGMHTSSARQARRYAGDGFGMCTLPSDYALLTSAALSELNEARHGSPG
jgi:4-hydroxy-2-oxoheptanedioate aldolase